MIIFQFIIIKLYFDIQNQRIIGLFYFKNDGLNIIIITLPLFEVILNK